MYGMLKSIRTIQSLGCNEMPDKQGCTELKNISKFSIIINWMKVGWYVVSSLYTGCSLSLRRV